MTNRVLLFSEQIEGRKNALLQEQLAAFVEAQQTFFADSLSAVKERGKKGASLTLTPHSRGSTSEDEPAEVEETDSTTV